MIPLARTARFLALLVLIASPAQAQWDPYGIPVTTAANAQDQVSAVSDGAGGMIVAWRDQRADPGDIYVQRVSGTGAPLWAPGGVAVCTAANQQLLPQIVTDGAGGAILAWQDNRVDPLGDIYAQRVDAGGSVLWLANGVPLITGASENIESVSRFRMIPDGVGGAIFTFSDNRFSFGGFDPGIPKVWAERVTAFGSPLWSPGGVPVAALGGEYESASLAPDGHGGIIVTWTDDSAGDWNIRAQHMDASGAPQWGAGVLVCGVAGKQLYPEIVPDGTGGAVIAWQDNRLDGNGDIYAQRLSAGGAPQWTADGNVEVDGPSANNSGDYIIRMIQDGSDGFVLAFADDRKTNGSPDPGFPKVWAQRIDPHGNPRWSNGVPVAGGPGTHIAQRILTDTEGGAIVAYQEGSAPANNNIFAQRLDPTGAPLWGPGVSVCNALGIQAAPAAIADGLGGVLAAWADLRSGINDVYAQYVDFTGVPSTNPRWECDSWNPSGVPVDTKVNLQSDPAAASDGMGGSIIVWRDEKSDTGDVYAQRLNSHGVPLWAPGGVPICIQPGLQQEPRIVPDGAGGAIIVWQDNRIDPAGDLAAQRVDPSGNMLWAANGVPIVLGPSANVEDPSSFRIVSDGVGGAIVTFQDTRRPDGVIDGIRHVWAQRVDGTGAPLWGNGVPVCTTSGEEQHGAPVSDGAGGVIVTWMQTGPGLLDIWGQRLDYTGTRRWGGSIFVCSFASNQLFPDITSDGAGGAIVSWVDTRADANGDIFAQKLTPLGGAVWAANGVPLVVGPTHNLIFGLSDHIRMISDNAGGAFLAFLDTRDTGGVVGTVAKIWAQQCKASGVPGWGNGVAVAAAAGSHFYHSIVSDGEGGSVIVWQENPIVDWNLRAQRMSPFGGAYWLGGGVPVCDLPFQQTRLAVTSDGRGHAIAAWSDSRSDAGDIYAERICVANRTTTGVAVRPSSDAPSLLAAPTPNPAADAISYTVWMRKPGRVRVVLTDARGRSVATLLDRGLEAGTHAYTWPLRSESRNLAAGVYFLAAISAEGKVARKVIVLR